MYFLVDLLIKHSMLCST